MFVFLDQSCLTQDAFFWFDSFAWHNFSFKLQGTFFVSSNHSTFCQSILLLLLSAVHASAKKTSRLKPLQCLKRVSQTRASKQSEELHSMAIEEDSGCNRSITLQALSRYLGEQQINQSYTNLFIKIYYIIFKWLWIKKYHQTHRSCPILKPRSSSFSLKFLPFSLLRLEISLTYFKSILKAKII